MIDTLKTVKNPNRIILNTDFNKDIVWFNTFLTQFNGTVFFNPKPIYGVFEIDACLQGLGGRYNDFVYHLPLTETQTAYNICQLEMLNVLVSLRTWGYIFEIKN